MIDLRLDSWFVRSALWFFLHFGSPWCNQVLFWLLWFFRFVPFAAQHFQSISVSFFRVFFLFYFIFLNSEQALILALEWKSLRQFESCTPPPASGTFENSAREQIFVSGEYSQTPEKTEKATILNTQLFPPPKIK